MSRRASQLFFAIAISTLAFATPVHAQKKEPDDPATAEAKARFTEGLKLAEAGDHESARLKFGQAWSLLKSPAIIYNLARSEQLSHHPVEALVHFRIFMKMAADPKVREKDKESANDNIAELSRKVGQIDVDAAANSKITIDGNPAEWVSGNDPIPVLPGPHKVEATLDGNTKSVTVTADPGTVAKARLQEAAKPPPPVTTPPPAPTEPPKEQGPGFWTPGRAVAAGLVGAGVGAVVAAVAFQLKAGSINDEADKIRPSDPHACLPPTTNPQCATLKSDQSDLASAETLRTVFLIGGGTLIAGGAVLFLMSPPVKKSEPATGWHFAPWATARDAGIGVYGRF